MMAEESKGKGWFSFLRKYINGEIPLGVYVKVLDRRGDGITYYELTENKEFKFAGMRHIAKI
jgi:hypothetical protein